MESMQSMSPQIGDFKSETPGRPPGRSKPPAGSAHKRTYQACLACRNRKVRCDLGSVDEPGDPPCQRCKREKKECVFSDTRRKKKIDDDVDLGGLGDEFVVRNKRARTSNSSIDALRIGNIAPGPYGEVTGGISYQDENSELGIEGGRKKGGNPSVQNQAAAKLFSNLISGPPDALRMLVDAAEQTQSDDHAFVRRESGHELPSSGREIARRVSGLLGDALMPAIDPRIVQMQQTMESDPEMANAVQAWSSLRFVRAGWFTPQEGIAYVKYFYEHMEPLSPVSPPDYSSLASHTKLLNEEPMLTVTILTIASRYMELKSPGGRSRSFWMHDKLWHYLQGMITRMFWGQEQFGGGFCGAGPVKSIEEAEARRRGLRSLGTVESLLLLSDWLPRSMHFPPGDDGDELMAPAPDANDIIDVAGPNVITGWIEPAIRSDRMCWSLIGMAYTLAFELGVFDSLIELKKWTVGPQTKTYYDPERADRIGRMLFVYVSQTCGRLGFPNMMPHQGIENDFDFLKMDVPPGTYSGPYPSVTIVDNSQRAWAELTALMRQTNTEMFESKQHTSISVHSGEYMQFLERFGPKLQDWKQRFDQTEILPKARIMIMMEFEYARIYINSLALQAVLEKCATGTQDVEENDGPSVAHTPPGLFSSKLVDIYKQNDPYIKEVTDAARNLLELAANELRADGGLKHAPVRTHFRVLSGAMFLLKTFALGGKESEVSKSIRLLDKTIIALREAVPDDVHLSLRISELLSNLTNSLRHKFVRLAVLSRANKRSIGTQQQQHQRPSTSHPNQNGPNSNSLNTPPTGTSAADHRRHSSLTFNAAGNNSSTSREFYTALGLVQPPPLVDPNDPNITIMPPPDFINHQGAYELYGMNAGTNSPHSASGSANVYSRPNSATGTGSGGLNGHSPTALHSPSSSGVAGSGGNSSRAQRPRHGSSSHPHGTVPFSPQNASGYDWLTLDFNPLLNSNLHGHPSGNTGQSGNTISGIGSSTGAGAGSNLGRGISPNAPSGFGSSNEERGYAPSAWAGGAFGPEISEGLEWLNAFSAVPNVNWEETTAQGSGYGSVLE